MKVLLILSVVAAAALARPEDLYDESIQLDVDELISNERLMKAYTACLLSKGPCTAEGSKVKQILPEAVENVCAKCTPKQRGMVRKMVVAVRERLPSEWEELEALYDPEGKYQAKFQEFLAQNE